MNISVLGLSGPENDRGAEGIGKSCLCNRIVRPSADDYQEQHLWLLSSSDFNSRVVNGDQFLFWGPTNVLFSGSEYSVNIIEQTEFIHDETLKPFSSPQPYVKRAALTKLRSHDKLAFFSKFQLGFENEYPAIPLPSEISINGFVLCYDVSLQHKSLQDIQDQMFCKLALEIHKTSKPFVIVATKMDVADSETVGHLYDLVNGNRYLKNAIIIETSAKLNINVGPAISALVNVILKPSNISKLKFLKFSEALAKQLVVDQSLREQFATYLLQHFTDWSLKWSSCETLITRTPIYASFLDRFGNLNARKAFDHHMNQLCVKMANTTIRQWLCDLPAVFSEMLVGLPDLSECLDADTVLSDTDLYDVFKLCLPKLLSHPRFDAYFQNRRLFQSFSSFPVGNGQPLLELIRSDKRIPVDIFDSPRAFDAFKNTFRTLKQKKQTERLKQDLKRLLESDLDYAPGMKTDESLLFVRSKYGNMFDFLEELDQSAIFDEVQRALADNAILDLRNLIEQSCADIVFDSTTFLEVAVDKAERILSTRTRFRRCDRLPQLRTQVLRDWLVAARNGDCRSCPAGSSQNCMSNKIRNSLGMRSTAAPRRFGILLVGSKREAVDVETAAKETWPEAVVKIESPQTCARTQSSSIHQFRLDFVRFSGDVILGANEQQTKAVQRADAIIFLISSDSSFKLASESLHNINSGASVIAPCVLCVFPITDGFDIYQNVRQLAAFHGAEFADCRQSMVAVTQAINKLALSATQLVANACSTKTPDVRIAFFCRCADQYSTDLIIGPLLRGSCLHLDSNDDQLPSCVSIVRQHLFLDSFKRTVQILMLPYHGRANPAIFHAVERAHGVILAFNPCSLHSFATMAAEANRRAGIPVFILAVDESGGLDTLCQNEPSRSILNDAASLAERLSAHFVKTSTDFANQSAVYTPFIRNAYENREKTEQLIAMYQLQKAKASPPPNFYAKDIAVNSLGRSSRSTGSVKGTSSLNHLGLVLPQSSTSVYGKEKGSKKNSPLQSFYQTQIDLWPITEHQLDTSGVSLPIAALIRAIDRLEGSSFLGIYRVPGSSLNSQQLIQQLRGNSSMNEAELTLSYDVQTLATTLKAVISKSCILSDELASALVEPFSKDSVASRSVILEMLTHLLGDSSKLPQSPHRLTLRLLFSHLDSVARKQPDTMNAMNLARVFWPSLLEPLTKNIEALEQVTRLQNMAEAALVFLIENWEIVLPL